MGSQKKDALKQVVQENSTVDAVVTKKLKITDFFMK